MNKFVPYYHENLHVKISNASKSIIMRCDHCGIELWTKTFLERLNFYDIHKTCEKNEVIEGAEQ